MQQNFPLPSTMDEKHKPGCVSSKAEQESENLTPSLFVDEEQHSDVPLAHSNGIKVISSQEEEEVVQARQSTFPRTSSTKSSETMGAGDVGIALVAIASLPAVLPLAAIVWGVRKMFSKRAN